MKPVVRITNYDTLLQRAGQCFAREQGAIEYVAAELLQFRDQMIKEYADPDMVTQFEHDGVARPESWSWGQWIAMFKPTWTEGQVEQHLWEAFFDHAAPQIAGCAQLMLMAGWVAK